MVNKLLLRLKLGNLPCTHHVAREPAPIGCRHFNTLPSSGPRYLLWKEDVSCLGSESTLGYEVYEHNNGFWSFEVIGQDWCSEVVAFFLEDWELGRVALSCHMAMDFLLWAQSRWVLRSLCSQCQKSSFAEPSQQQSLSLTVEGL